MQFDAWFLATFKVPAPGAYREFLTGHPKGARNEFGPTLWDAQRVMDHEDNAGNAMACVIGEDNALSRILMRPSDGKIFVIDRQDHKIVDASFSGIDTLYRLLSLGPTQPPSVF